ncbi:hypothetical protein [Flavobacterium restrictum]|uniref:HNH endonuclease n=1 Tax=Flavobacterium restrictum TaxID=2594428 RepID=A0A553DV63_9FLAO|nr:hypothetical protein [Flavobacterium restrictum]TRX36651.1 hypothetical protein FNW21_13070 [Flavobacterium restrictum]
MTEIEEKFNLEILKRDLFTCVFCGVKSPENLLFVFRISENKNNLPVFVTSCYSCSEIENNKIIYNDLIFEKHIKKSERVKESRKQLEQQLEWIKDLPNFETEKIELIVNYVNGKIKPVFLQDDGKKIIAEWETKYGIEKLINAIDISTKSYLFDSLSEHRLNVVALFFDKIGGILYNMSLAPIQNKIANIRAIGRNKHSSWDNRIANIILKNYVGELEKHLTENEIIEDLETEVMQITKKAKNWFDWKNILEKWTTDIQDWKKEGVTEIVKKSRKK